MTSKRLLPIAVLIHGTFARNAEWTSPDSAAARKIKQTLGENAVVTRFNWSGKNSHAERLKAGKALAEFLRNLKQEHPGGRFYLVAHSHGGNVVAYAMKDRDIREATEKVACLGTPFIQTRNRDLNPTIRLFRYIGYALIAACLLLLFAFMITYLSGDILEPGEDTLFFRILLAGFVVTFFYFILHFGNRFANYVKKQVIPSLKRKQLEIADSLDSSFNNIPILTVRAFRDEASGYLSILNKIANLPFRLWAPAVVYWSGAGLTAIIIIVWLIVGFSPDFIQSEGWIGAIVAIAGGLAIFVVMLIAGATALFLIAMLLCLIWPKIFRGHALGFGEKGFVNNWLVSINASPQPLGTASLQETIVELDGGAGFSLRHSRLYRDGQVLQRVAEWLNSRGS